MTLKLSQWRSLKYSSYINQLVCASCLRHRCVCVLGRRSKFSFWHSYSTQNQQQPYQKLSEKWLLITSLSGCSLEQKLPSSVNVNGTRTRPGTPFLMSANPGLCSGLECPNLISSNSFAHRLGTGNSALRLAPGLVGLKPELRQGRSEFIDKIFFGTFFINYLKHEGFPSCLFASSLFSKKILK